MHLTTPLKCPASNAKACFCLVQRDACFDFQLFVFLVSLHQYKRQGKMWQGEAGLVGNEHDHIRQETVPNDMWKARVSLKSPAADRHNTIRL